jgi:hypothetical protein
MVAILFNGGDPVQRQRSCSTAAILFNDGDRSN